ncbi:MAG: C40 family peptidase [Bacteroidota bacterium]|nr:C40 family peptidase [Bacteroidota bacterium]
MVSQLLFGEKSVIIEQRDGQWIKVRLKYDGYEGWCQQGHSAEIDEEHYTNVDKDLTAGWVNEIDYNGHRMNVPLGSSLSAFKNGKAFWRKNSVHFKGEVWNPEEIKVTPKLIKQVAYKFLNTSYLWGGKSVFGIDCSGFAQMTYKFINKQLPRDAWQQAEQGEVVNFLQQAHCGDLAFFDNEDGQIIHVGILLNENEIIHSSGKVRIDKIDNQGILNLETKLRTHKLRIIKRYF